MPDATSATGAAIVDGKSLDELACGTIRALDGRVVGWSGAFEGEGHVRLYAHPYPKTATSTATYEVWRGFNGENAESAGTDAKIELADHGHRGSVTLGFGRVEFHCNAADDTADTSSAPPVVPTAPGTGWVVDAAGGLFTFPNIVCAPIEAALDVVTPVASASDFDGRSFHVAIRAPVTRGANVAEGVSWTVHAAELQYFREMPSLDRGYDGAMDATVTLTGGDPQAGTFRVVARRTGQQLTRGGFVCPRATAR